MNLLRVRLLSSTGVVYEGEAKSIIVPALKGPSSLCYSTTSMQLELDPSGVITVIEETKKLYFAGFSGFASVKDGVANVICLYLEKGSDIDAARANESKKRAEERLSKKQDGIDIARAQASLSRALTRLEAKRLNAGGSL